MSGKKKKLIPIDREFLETIARILGAQSSAQAALDEFDRRKLAGENVALFEGPRCFLVWPAMEPRQ